MLNEPRMKIRTVSELSDSLSEAIRKIINHFDALSSSVPRIRSGWVSAVTDAEPTSTSWATVDFSKDFPTPPPAKARGAFVSWRTSFGTPVDLLYREDASADTKTIGYAGSLVTNAPIFFTDGGYTAQFSLGGAPGAITTNQISVIGWIY